ncbi:RfbA dTDP-glucose pyrophosphorylase [Candidatus Nanopelagicaceae bacterium]
MNGILLAGGSGTRLWPNTQVTSKQLLPVYDKPMIYYSLTTLMLSGVRNVVLVTNQNHVSDFRSLLHDGSQWGISISYEVQDKPRGIADSFRLVPMEMRNQPIALMLGDNFLYGAGLGLSLENVYSNEGALAFSYGVKNPEEYGVFSFSESGEISGIVEKPVKFVSSQAIPGLYYFDQNVFEIAANLVPSSRGELEITDVLREYLHRGLLKVKPLARGTSWLDTGSADSLLEASEFVRTIEKRQGLSIGSPDEVAYRMGLISTEHFSKLIGAMPVCSYKEYLQAILLTS